MVCKKCGNQMPDSTKFCSKCGCIANESPKITFCPDCGAQTDPSNGVCPRCGRSERVAIHDDYSSKFITRKKSKLIPALAAAAVVVVIAVLSVVIGYTLYGNISDTNTAEDEYVISDELATDVPTENSDNSDSNSDIFGTIDATPTPLPTPMPTPAPTPVITSNTTVIATYYVANCSEYVTLRQTPVTSSAELAKIYYGQAVGYIENAGNGFSKVIYNGTVGYVLTKYLSADTPQANTANTQSNSADSQKVTYSKPQFTYAAASSVRSNMQDSSGNTVNYSPNNVLDGNNSTCWAMDVTTGIEPSITLRSNETQYVSGVKFSNGYFKSQKLYDANRKITKVQILYEGGSKTYSCSSSQYMVLQDVKFDSVISTSYITIKILESTDAAYSDICISTVEAY